jgi:hypothetical protein
MPKLNNWFDDLNKLIQGFKLMLASPPTTATDGTVSIPKKQTV